MERGLWPPRLPLPPHTQRVCSAGGGCDSPWGREGGGGGALVTGLGFSIISFFYFPAWVTDKTSCEDVFSLRRPPIGKNISLNLSKCEPVNAREASAGFWRDLDVDRTHIKYSAVRHRRCWAAQQRRGRGGAAADAAPPALVPPPLWDGVARGVGRSAADWTGVA